MKKSDKETNRIGKLRVPGETVRVLTTSDLQQVAGGEGTENPKRPI